MSQKDILSFTNNHREGGTIFAGPLFILEAAFIISLFLLQYICQVTEKAARFDLCSEQRGSLASPDYNTHSSGAWAFCLSRSNAPQRTDLTQML